MRIGCVTIHRRRNADLLHNLEYTLFFLLALHTIERPRRITVANDVMQPQRLANLFANCECGVECRKRILEDHGDLLATHCPHLVIVHLQEIIPSKAYFSAFDFAGITNETQQRKQHGAFTASRFADNTKDLTFVQCKADVIHGAYKFFARGENGVQVLDFQ